MVTGQPSNFWYMRERSSRMEFRFHLFLWLFHFPERKDCTACSQLDVRPIIKGSSMEFFLKLFIKDFSLQLKFFVTAVLVLRKRSHVSNKQHRKKI